MTLLRPVSPYRGLRTVDAFGGGGYGAPRIGPDGHRYDHMGQDFVAEPGDSVVAPCVCRVTHVGLAYADDPTLGSVHLEGLDDAAAFRLKLLYVQPHPECLVGALFDAGTILGVAQDRRLYHGESAITNHVHLEIRLHGDGADHLANPCWYVAGDAA